MAVIVMPLRYIISASARWASVRIVCFRVIVLANLVPSSYGYLLLGLSIETSPLSRLSSIEVQQSQALLTFFKFSVDKGIVKKQSFIKTALQIGGLFLQYGCVLIKDEFCFPMKLQKSAWKLF